MVASRKGTCLRAVKLLGEPVLARLRRLLSIEPAQRKPIATRSARGSTGSARTDMIAVAGRTGSQSTCKG